MNASDNDYTQLEMPNIMTEKPKRYRGQRGPNKVKKECMKLVAIRLPQYVVDHFNGSSISMRIALIESIKPKT